LALGAAFEEVQGEYARRCAPRGGRTRASERERESSSSCSNTSSAVNLSVCALIALGVLLGPVRLLKSGRNPGLLKKHKPTAPKCLLCSFSGSADTEGLCSVCFKKWSAAAAATREDLGALRQARRAHEVEQ
jgi:hypothetical protein